MAPKPFPALADAVAKYSGDQYSQLKRWSNGYSDCSSIIGKALRDLGIDPPGASTTLDYAAWNQLQEVSRSEVTKGDIINKGGAHCVVALDNVNAIGQQRPGRNVQIGKIDGNLMYGATPYKCLRYIGPRPGEDNLKEAGFLPNIPLPPFSGLDIFRGGDSTKDFIEGPAGDFAGGIAEGIYDNTAGKLITWLMTPNDEGVSPGLRVVMFIGGGVLIIIAAVALTRSIGIKAAAPIAKAVVAGKGKSKVAA